MPADHKDLLAIAAPALGKLRDWVWSLGSVQGRPAVVITRTLTGCGTTAVILSRGAATVVVLDARGERLIEAPHSIAGAVESVVRRG